MISRGKGVTFPSRRALLLLLWCGKGCAPSEHELGQAELLGGAVSTEDSAVVAVVAGDGGRCTGTLIHPRVVLTAAHCFLYGPPTDVLPGTDPRRATRAPVSSWTVPREYDTRNDHADIALLALAAPLDTSVIAMVGAVDELGPGEQVRLVGFGPRERVERTTGQAAVSGIEQASFMVKAAPTRPCAGDSGGPALVVRDGREVVVGVASGGDQECARDGETRYSRLGPLSQSFLVPALDRIARGEADPRGQLGQPCTSAGACESLICIEGSQPDDGYCSRTCVPGDPGACAAGFDCTAVEDDELGFACTPRARGGCSVGGPGGAPPGSSALPAIVVAGVLARLARRPRKRDAR